MARVFLINTYPYGLLDARVVEAVGARYERAVTTRMAALAAEPSEASSENDPLRVPRLDAYYLRHPALQRRFGEPAFRALMAFRASLRRWRRHPGEHA